jgi:hypothetical protein
VRAEPVIVLDVRAPRFDIAVMPQKRPSQRRAPGVGAAERESEDAMTTDGQPRIPADDVSEDRPRQTLRRDSDALLEAVDKLRAVEREKRATPISTPEFHELADQAHNVSKQIFSLSDEQLGLGQAIPEGSRPIEETPPD